MRHNYTMTTKPFYPNAIQSAEDLLTGIRNGTSYQVLVADMQSGKSGTFMLTAIRALMERLVDHVLIMTGNRDCELKQQCIQNKEDYIETYLYSDSKGHSTPLTDAYHSYLEKRIQIAWGQDLCKYTVEPKTLIIWEESHSAQSIDNHPDKFFKRNGISVNGDPISRSIYVISVSATPFSELSDVICMSQTKQIVRLQPGDTYRGLRWYNENGLITYMDPADIVDTMETAIRELSTQTTLGWGIIRGTSAYKAHAEALCIQYGVDFILHSQEYRGLGSESFDALMEPPPNPTVVFVKGFCRMGKEIPKRHISFVFESSLSPFSDTIFQALPGRVCGYPNGIYGYYDNDSLRIYVAKRAEAVIQQYIQYSSEIQTHQLPSVIPVRAKNVLANSAPATTLKQKQETNRLKHLAVPVWIPFHEFERLMNHEDNDDTYLAVLRYLRSPHRQERIREYVASVNTSEQTEEFMNTIIKYVDPRTVSKKVSHRNLIGKTYLQNKVDIRLYQSHQQKKTMEYFTDETKLTIVCVPLTYETKPPLRPCSPGDVYLVFSTDVKPMTQETTSVNTVEDHRIRMDGIPLTTKKEIFAYSHFQRMERD